MNTRTELLPPEVPETTVSPDLLQPLQIFSQLVIQAVGEDLKSDTGMVTGCLELARPIKYFCVNLVQV